ncbi:hypothetical protein [Streptomyces canus]
MKPSRSSGAFRRRVCWLLPYGRGTGPGACMRAGRGPGR